MTEPNGRTQPGKFHRLTVEHVRKDRADGLLTAKGAIFYTVIAAQKPGTQMKVNPQTLIKALKIHRSTFYRAIAELKVEKRLDFEVEGNLILHIPVNELTGEPQYLLSEEILQSRDFESQKCDKQSQKSDDESQKSDTLSQKSDDVSQICENEGLKHLSGNRFSPSSDITDHTDITDKREREHDPGEDFDQQFRNWLINKANLLPKKPVLLEQWIAKEMVKASNKKQFTQHQASMQVTPIPEILPTEQINPKDYWAKVNARSGGMSHE